MKWSKPNPLAAASIAGEQQSAVQVPADQYLPNWAMQDVIDIRVAVIDRSWFYGEPSNAEAKDKK